MTSRDFLKLYKQTYSRMLQWKMLAQENLDKHPLPSEKTKIKEARWMSFVRFTELRSVFESLTGFEWESTSLSLGCMPSLDDVMELTQLRKRRNKTYEDD